MEGGSKDQEILPLWIADMDFPIFPEMSEAIEDFSHQMVFGYDSPKDSLYQAISNWEVQEHGYQFDKKSLLLIDGLYQRFQLPYKPSQRREMLF